MEVFVSWETTIFTIVPSNVNKKRISRDRVLCNPIVNDPMLVALYEEDR